LWLYDTIYNTWNESNPDATQTGMLWPAHGASAVSDDGVAYYYDGWLNENTISGWQGHPLMLRGLLSFDMTSFKWTNRTFDDDTPRAEGSLNNLPVSDRGMLVYMGGIETTSSGAVMFVCHSCTYMRASSTETQQADMGVSRNRTTMPAQI
jgi:hypothetical protein